MSGATPRRFGLLQRPFRGLHGAWALLILAGCVALFFMGGGHPPPMAFIPFLLLAGFAVHLLLLLVEWLLHRGRSRFANAHAEAARWPPELGLIGMVLGVLAVASVVITVGEYPRLLVKPLEWLLFAAIAAGHTAAFVLLLLRMDAARYLVALVCLGWALALLLQLGEARPGELPLGIALIAGLAAIAAYVLRARRVRSVFL